MTKKRTSKRADVLRVGGSAAMSACALAAAGMSFAGPAAAAQTLTYHYRSDLSGLTITCGTTQVTALPGGAFDAVFHENADSRGDYHVTGTATPESVTLADTSGNTYSLHGSSWFGGTFSDPDGNNPVVFTTTDEFTVTNAAGGLLGKVSAIMHLNPNGTFFSLNLGDCTDSNGP